MAPNQNPFKPAQKLNKRVKLLVFGDSGTGKTTLALQLHKFAGGKVAVIDTEGGTDLYASAPGMPEFDVIRTRDYKGIIEALEFIGSGQHEYKLLIVDPITVIYNVIIEAQQTVRERSVASKNADPETATLTDREWGNIKRKMNKIYDMLVNLPLHVVVTAREKDEYKGKGDNREKIGSKPDAEKNLPYLFDMVLHLHKDQQGKRFGIVKKVRGLDIATRIDNITVDSLATLFTTQDKPGGAVAILPDHAKAVESLADDIEKEDRKATPSAPTIMPPINRPYSAEQVITRLKELEDGSKSPTLEKEAHNKNAQNYAIAAKAVMTDSQRHWLQERVWGKVSANDLSDQAIDALNKWLASGKQFVEQEIENLQAMMDVENTLYKEHDEAMQGS